MNESGYVLFELLIAFFIASLFMGLASTNIGPLKKLLDLRLSQWQLGTSLHEAREHAKSQFVDVFVTEYPDSMESLSSYSPGAGFTPYGRSKRATSLYLKNGEFSKKVVLSSAYGQVRFE